MLAVIAFLFVGFGTGLVVFLPNNRDTELISGSKEEKGRRQVVVTSVRDLSTAQDPLPLIGSVTSKAEASIRAGSSGEIVRILSSLGSTVSAGTVLAEIENSSQRASVLQAEGAVAGARAALLKAERGIRGEQQSILEIEFINAEHNLFETKKSARDAIKSAFITADNAIRNTADQLYENPRTNPQLIFLVKNIQLEIDLESGRFQIERILTDWEASLDVLTLDKDLFTDLNTAHSNLTKIQTFLDTVANAVNAATPSTNFSQTQLDAWRASISGARTTMGASLTGITAMQTNLKNSNSSYNVSEKRLEEGVSGNREEDIQSAKAFLTQMIGSLRGAEANVSKTIIRSPIAGTVTRFDIKHGDFVSAFELVAVVSNELTLEVITYITVDDLSDVFVGSEARINGVLRGVVSEIAPAVDPHTQKIEIKVALTEKNTSLTSGQSVRVEIVRVPSELASKPISTITIPVAALKVRPSDVVVFTVGSDGLLEAHSVHQGPLIGGSIVIENGLTADMEIVIDARGLAEGEMVIVSN